MSLNWVSYVTGLLKIKGDTDDTKIGNVGDSIKANVTASALPTGASTGAKQDTGNTSLSSIDTKLTDNATATNQGTNHTRLGSLTEAAPASDTASSGLNGRLQRLAQRLTTMLTTLTDGSLQTKIRGDTDGTLIGNQNDSLKVVDTDLLLEISGGAAGFNQVNKFGHNSNVGNSNFEDVWETGGTIQWPTSAQTYDIVSDDTNDTSAGTGARTVEIEGLDGSYVEQSETVTLNGTTPVTTVNSYLRVFRGKVMTAGSGGENAGSLTATQNVSGYVAWTIVPTANQSLVAAYTVPAGKTAHLLTWFIGLKTGKATDILMQVRPENEVFQTKRWLTVDEATTQVWNPYLNIAEKSDMRVRTKASTGSHEVSSGFDIILVDN